MKNNYIFLFLLSASFMVLADDAEQAHYRTVYRSKSKVMSVSESQSKLVSRVLSNATRCYEQRKLTVDRDITKTKMVFEIVLSQAKDKTQTISHYMYKDTTGFVKRKMQSIFLLVDFVPKSSGTEATIYYNRALARDAMIKWIKNESDGCPDLKRIFVP